MLIPLARSMTETIPAVSIIVVSYNTRQLTLQCLRSVVAETEIPYELIVVDSASSDGSAEAIAQEFPQICFMAEKENHGFAKANNIAAERARGEYIPAKSRYGCARFCDRQARRLCPHQAEGEDLGGPNAVRRSDPQQDLLLATHDAMERLLSGYGADGTV